MDMFWNALKEPFTWGLLAGLVVAGFIWKSGFSARRAARRELRILKQEIDLLKEHLHRQMEIGAKGNAAVQEEAALLRTQCENLRIRIAELQQKPDRQVQRRLETHEMALRALREQAPGFASAWEAAVRQAEESLAGADSGLKRLVARVIPGISTGQPAAPRPPGE